MKECDILSWGGAKHTLTPATYFQRGQDPLPNPSMTYSPDTTSRWSFSAWIALRSRCDLLMTDEFQYCLKFIILTDRPASVTVTRYASGCVVECRTCNEEVAGSNLSLGYFAQRSIGYSAFHPSWVGKWVPDIAGKAKAGMAHSDCGWTFGCAGKTVKSLENTCHYMSASAVVIHYEEALYQVYEPYSASWLNTMSPTRSRFP